MLSSQSERRLPGLCATVVYVTLILEKKNAFLSPSLMHYLSDLLYNTQVKLTIPLVNVPSTDVGMGAVWCVVSVCSSLCQ